MAPASITVTTQGIIILEGVLTTTFSILLIARIIASYRFSRRSIYLHIENFLALLALCLVWAAIGCSLWRWTRFAKDPFSVPREMHALLLLIEILCYHSIMWCIKGAFLCMYLNVTEGLPMRSRWILWTGCGIIGVTYLAVMGLHFGYCWPFPRNWSFGPDMCRINVAAPIVTTATLHILTDLMVMLLPIFLFWKVVKRNRFAVAFLMSLGCVCVVASILRIALAYGGNINDHGNNPHRALENGRRAELWVVVEVTVACIASSLPALRTAYHRLSKKRDPTTTMGSMELSGRRTGNSGSHGGSHGSSFPYGKNSGGRHTWSSHESGIGVLSDLRETTSRDDSL